MRRPKSGCTAGSFVNGLAVHRLWLLVLFSALWFTPAILSPSRAAGPPRAFFPLHAQLSRIFFPAKRTNGASTGSSSSQQLVEMEPTQPESLPSEPLPPSTINARQRPERRQRLQSGSLTEASVSSENHGARLPAQVDVSPDTPDVPPGGSMQQDLPTVDPAAGLSPQTTHLGAPWHFLRNQMRSAARKARSVSQSVTISENRVNRHHRDSLETRSPTFHTEPETGRLTARRQRLMTSPPHIDSDDGPGKGTAAPNRIQSGTFLVCRLLTTDMSAGHAELQKRLGARTGGTRNRLQAEECEHAHGAHFALQLGDRRQKFSRAPIEFALDATFPRETDVQFKSDISRKIVTLRRGRVLGVGSRCIVVEVMRVETGDKWALKAFVVPRHQFPTHGTPPPWDTFNKEAFAIQQLKHTVPVVVYRNLRFLVPTDVLTLQGDKTEALRNRHEIGPAFFATYLLFPLAEGSLSDVIEVMFPETKASNAVVLRDNEAQALGARLTFSLQIVRLTALLHGQGVVHGDLQAKSFFLCQDGSLFLGGFRHLVRAGDPYQSPRPETVGTRCTPPEVLTPPKNAKFTFSLNAWGVGCILYQLWCGVLPFDLSPKPETTTRVILPHLLTPPYLLKKRFGKGSNSASPAKFLRFRGCVQNMPVEMHDLIGRMLQENPRSRLLPTQAVGDPVFKRVEEQSLVQEVQI
ncbi:unnamed protein product [Neospora caninum Liverpool]|uniref:Polo kinase n=1 Tax=Neospora caninum (strain Liverpool) TaxID=572307 RepID=F0VFE4_NEOCL|nr:uncharacterized protein NCLIV_022270 [Neospora caninum Liverpool]CBZ52438.1 unnamed protein product [Neospora caninum Liverpool]CEL66412.1 TPA: polo kinase [Neospora caninum Liverpool]|eukprot:XP_003882470.1 uncharacterized protein NCLIV_022270 [Neospora caninum Liverpool]